MGAASGLRGTGGEVAGEDKNDARPVIWAGVSCRILHLSCICKRAQSFAEMEGPMP